MAFTRHAKNKLRRYGLTQADIETLMADPTERGARSTGTPTAVGTIAGTRYRVIFVLEDGLTTVITI